MKNDVIDGYYKKALDSHNVGEAVYRIAIDPKPKLRQCARFLLGLVSLVAWLVTPMWAPAYCGRVLMTTDVLQLGGSDVQS